MKVSEAYKAGQIGEKARKLFAQERDLGRLDGWFLARETGYLHREELEKLPEELAAARRLELIIDMLPLTISEHAVFAGTQRDAFARTYALINPAFQVETFCGYCDATAVFDDIEPNEEFTPERIGAVKKYMEDSPYVRKLKEVYGACEDYTGEVAFFIEQVTGHVIPDFRGALREGVKPMIEKLEKRAEQEIDEKKKNNCKAMALTLKSAIKLARRYEKLAREQQKDAEPERQKQLQLLADTLHKVPEQGAGSLYEAIQSFLILWQVMCMEQAPNPYAFSVGNADRIFEPYRAMEQLGRQEASDLFKHFLVFFNVGDRSWAISQNVIISGRDTAGRDLTNEMSYAIMDAYYDMNFPQPILSVKLHKNTPDEIYKYMGKFFFSPGVLTPSLFNDDAVFEVLKKGGVEEGDLPDYSIAGCQEPLIMGKDNGNTTNSWLNLGKILELTLNHGKSLITGKRMGPDTVQGLSKREVLERIREKFYENAEYYVSHMITAANGASEAISREPVPFLSAFMGGMETAVDMRDTEEQGTKYNGSGCLIHGLSVVADAFLAIDRLLAEKPEEAENLLPALENNFEGYEDLQDFLLAAPKFGNNIPEVDQEAAQIAEKIADLVASQKNYLGNPFRPDYSTPSTHLLYGYWTGATPDGRKSREMLNYGVDPLYGEAGQGLGFRILSALKLPYGKFQGGYASHYGIDPKLFTGKTYEERGLQFKTRVLAPTFFNERNKNIAPFYLYVNVTTPEILRKVLENPKKYAPSGVYIMRIHGTFVNFLDLSPAIQQDIIKRLDLNSTRV
ncbi:MAG: hypothetical protein HFI33_08765 [Lachnospiraceae bacterium]|nr:hypothetical protein [Lachnospiraceae bacterium]